VSLDDTLTAIDAATGCQWCHGPLGDSVSESFCSEAHQRAWHESRSERLVGYVEPWHRPWDFPGVGSDAARYSMGGHREHGEPCRYTANCGGWVGQHSPGPRIGLPPPQITVSVNPEDVIAAVRRVDEALRHAWRVPIPWDASAGTLISAARLNMMEAGIEEAGDVETSDADLAPETPQQRALRLTRERNTGPVRNRHEHRGRS